MRRWRLSKYLVCAFVILPLLTANGNASYHMGQTEKNTFFRSERGLVSWGAGDRAYVFYDNFNHYPARSRQGPAVCPGSEYFVPLDSISIDVPIRIAFRNPISVENMLASLVNANLRLKKLLDEYETLQKESREILKGLTIPRAESDLSGFWQEEPTNSIHRVHEKLKQDHLNVARFIGDFGPDPETTETVERVGTDSLAQALDRKNRQEAPTGDFAAIQGSGAGYRAYGPIDSGAASGPDDRVLDLSRRRQVGFVDSQEASLPWVLRACLKVFRCMFSHKFESLVIGVLILCVITAWSSLRPRSGGRRITSNERRR